MCVLRCPAMDCASLGEPRLGASVATLARLVTEFCERCGVDAESSWVLVHLVLGKVFGCDFALVLTPHRTAPRPQRCRQVWRSAGEADGQRGLPAQLAQTTGYQSYNQSSY